MTTDTFFYRIQFALEATRSIALPGRPAALLYALLSNANAMPEIPPAFPRDLMLDAPETNRTRVEGGQRYHFGGTLIASDDCQVQQVVSRLTSGLERLGKEGKSRSRGWGGNFRLAEVTDLVQKKPWSTTNCDPISLEHVNQETIPLLDQDQLTLRFETPLRLERGGKATRHGHSFFDEHHFDLKYFLRRLLRRLESVGLKLRDASFFDDEALAGEVVHRQLLWLDMAYGGRQGKTLGGTVGSITLQGLSALAKSALVWGQYARLGKNTNFGFGRYRIAELLDDPYRCQKAHSLLEIAWNHPQVDRLVANANLEPGNLQSAIDSIRSESYQPHPIQRLRIGNGEKVRMLQIPSRRDRVLQRMVLDTISPGIDELFEASSHAWRRGFGRQRSAKVIGKAYQDGYRFAVNADFDQFFESIPHTKLAQRLSAYLDDPTTEQLIWKWIRNSSDDSFGIPTGAPLSPLLGNLMLDRFDERIRESGGRLVRYGDDFLILCKDEPQANRLAAVALEEAQELELALNQEPLKLELSEPFTFLGFRFERHERWKMSGHSKPRRLEELGWRDAKSKEADKPWQVRIPGETGTIAPQAGLTGIVGPDATHFEVHEDEIVCHYADNQPAVNVPLAELETLVALGEIGFNAAMVRRLCQRNISVILADENGHVYATITDEDISRPDLVQAQVVANQDQEKRLAISKSLIAAKIANHAHLAGSLPKSDQSKVEFLKRSAQRAEKAETIGALLGVEGAAAAAWYQLFGRNVGPGFSFAARVAPSAEDPVNVLLNVGHTLFYRLNGLMIRSVGLLPGIGLLHEPNSRFDALATDLQEPFRHLVDRTVLEATHRLRPRDFVTTSDGPYRLRITPTAAREFQAMLWRTLCLETASSIPGDPHGYRVWMHRQVRHLARYLLEDHYPFHPFQHP